MPTRPAGTRRMTAVLLALASAACFGAMTVAIRAGLRDGADAMVAALATLMVAFAVVALALARASRLRGRVEVLPRRPARAGALAAPLHRSSVREVGASRTSVTVGHGAAVRARDRVRSARRAGRSVPLILGAARDRRRRGRCSRRSGTGPSHLRAARALLRARGGGALRRAGQHRPRPARARKPRDRRRGDDARRRARRARDLTRRVPTGRELAGSRLRGCSSASRTSACSRRTSTAACRSSRRSSRPSRSGASAWPRSSSAAREGVGRRVVLGARRDRRRRRGDLIAASTGGSLGSAIKRLRFS